MATRPKPPRQDWPPPEKKWSQLPVHRKFPIRSFHRTEPIEEDPFDYLVRVKIARDWYKHILKLPDDIFSRCLVPKKNLCTRLEYIAHPDRYPELRRILHPLTHLPPKSETWTGLFKELHVNMIIPVRCFSCGKVSFDPWYLVEHDLKLKLGVSR